MIEIPLGKAVAAMEKDGGEDCQGCFFYNADNCFKIFACRYHSNRDGINIIKRVNPRLCRGTPNV